MSKMVVICHLEGEIDIATLQEKHKGNTYFCRRCGDVHFINKKEKKKKK